jgi:hypothetical protein
MRERPTSPALKVVRGRSSRPFSSTSFMREPTTAASGLSSNASSSLSNRCGSDQSSASWRATISVRTSLRPRLRLGAIPMCGNWSSRTRASSYERTISGVSSVEPSSTTSSSSSGTV